MKKRKRINHGISPFWIILIIIIVLLGVVIEHGIADDFFQDKEPSGKIDVVINETIPSTTKQPEVTTEPETEVPPLTQETEEPTVTEPTTEESLANPSVPVEETYAPPIIEEETNPPTTDDEVIPENHGGTIYLTFDDGPSVEITPYVLDILAAKGVKATFFIVGYEPGTQREELVKRIYEEDHSIGLHGISHTYSKIYSSLEALESNFISLQDLIYESIGIRPIIIRFPGGSSNTVSKHYCPNIMTEATTYFTNQGFIYFDWNVDSRDAGGTDTADGVFNNVTSALKPGRRNIVLMHDSSSKMHTLEALEAIIDYGLENGYTFKVITSETESMAHSVANWIKAKKESFPLGSDSFHFIFTKYHLKMFSFYFPYSLFFRTFQLLVHEFLHLQ